ncbi:hypothetical protein [Romboutsia lituseburensis]|uniref:hypothetical protein n=1 Tax=Romboutsia lituseburensis TaxID=1537 RepID=UPI0022EA7219|nr:hypothetical protein [Romboutsia lituseburensis]
MNSNVLKSIKERYNFLNNVTYNNRDIETLEEEKEYLERRIAEEIERESLDLDLDYYNKQEDDEIWDSYKYYFAEDFDDDIDYNY